MNEETRQNGSGRKSALPLLCEIIVATLVAYPPAYLLHLWLVPTSRMKYAVQEVPFKPLIANQECFVTAIDIWNAGNTPLKGVRLTAQFSGRIIHWGTAEQEDVRIRTDNSTPCAGSTLQGNLGGLPVGGRRSIYVVSTGPSMREPAIASDEVVATRTTAAEPTHGYSVMAAVVCSIALLIALVYLLQAAYRREKAAREWAKVLGAYAFHKWRGSRRVA